jgi:hypothetical protein
MDKEFDEQVSKRFIEAMPFRKDAMNRNRIARHHTSRRPDDICLRFRVNSLVHRVNL